MLIFNMGPQLVPPSEGGMTEPATHAQAQVALLHVAGHVPLVGPREAAIQAHPQAQARRGRHLPQLFHHTLR